MARISGGWVGGQGVKELFKDQQSLRARAVRAGVGAAAEGLKTELRQNVEAAGLGQRLGNAIGANIYPRQESGSLAAAGYVFPRSPSAAKIFDAFNAGTPIRGKNGNWLAFPTSNAYLGGKGGRRPTPGEFEQRTGIKLRPIVPRSSKKGRYQLLVGESVHGRRSGRRAATKGRLRQGRAVETLVFFVLVRETRPGRRLDFDAIAQRWADRIPELIAAATPGDL